MNAEYDVLVAGGGNAALCAALTAREAGASVLIVEHAPRDCRGGNSRHTRNLRVMHEKPTATLVDAYSEAEYWSDLLGVTQGRTDERLARLTIRSTAELLPWIESRGVRFQPSLSGTLSLARTNAFFLGGGKALLNAYYITAERMGVDVLYDSEVKNLCLENGAVREAEIVSGGATRKLRPKTVVAASGGFQANIEWLREYWGEAADNFIVRGTPYAKGLLLKNLLDQGVAPVGDPTQCHCVAVDARAPKFDGGIVTRLDCIPFSIVVDRDGNRFYDEGQEFWPKRYAIWGRLVARQQGQVSYSITDSKAEQLFMPSVFPAVRGETIGELATQLGLDPSALEITVQNYNRAVRPGAFNPKVLDDCKTEGIDPPKTHWARTIDTPPFIGYPLRPGITFTYLGVKVDENAAVLMQNGQPVSNLFAAGEIMAGNILGQGYLAGLGMAIGTVFGRIAGREAAKVAQQ
ncbi:MAG TPA: FAD-dependent tricarballylate dehydrogenase TcuA [Candidatus Dormibacteraeota bacterium]|nr:FAD-dependent tricarballylate dehydrogenase TcuA [Candidatus Dormibacteraeota bacterium]